MQLTLDMYVVHAAEHGVEVLSGPSTVIEQGGVGVDIKGVVSHVRNRPHETTAGCLWGWYH